MFVFAFLVCFISLQLPSATNWCQSDTLRNNSRLFYGRCFSLPQVVNCWCLCLCRKK